MKLRMNTADALSAFVSWLAEHPVPGDRAFSNLSVRYQVARYCEYLASNPVAGANPLTDGSARDSAIIAYRAYLRTFGASPAMVDLIMVSIGRFYAFLGLGAPPANDGECPQP